MVEQTITPQDLAQILERGERNSETRGQAKAFLQEVAAILTDEIGPLAKDVGTKAQSDARKIEFIDRAYFYLAPDLEGTYFPMLTVYLFPGQLWWGLYAWGKESFARSVSEALQALDLVSADDIQEGTGAFHADSAWRGGGYVSAGRQLGPDGVAAYDDLTVLAQEIAGDLADWWRRLQPHLEALREQLGFPEEASAPDFPGSIDIVDRLEQWREEVTNPEHPNHFHADLELPAEHYAAIMELVEKLRENPSSFTREDVVELFDHLNSGTRMKNMVADNNALPALRRHLLELLDGEGEPDDRIRAAVSAINYAAHNMLGELYGWVHAENAPLFNQCATNALSYLGYDFDPNNYNSFVAAHEQFKQVYRQQAARLRPDLPLNLEIDKFYNVLDKVDLKAEQSEPKTPSGPLAAPFDAMFADYDEAEWIFDFFAQTARKLGFEEHDDTRFSVTLRHNNKTLRMNFGNWMVLDYSSSRREIEIALLSESVPQRYDFAPWGEPFAKTDRAVVVYQIPLAIMREMPDDLRRAYDESMQYIASRFAEWTVTPYRVAHRARIFEAFFDRQARRRILAKGVEVTPEAQIAKEFEGFSPEAFTFLADLAANNNRTWMHENRERYQEYVRETFRSLFKDLGPHLKGLFDPYLAPDSLSIEPKFGHTLATIKKRWPDEEGPYHPYYWGAFYRESLSKQTDAQLFVNIFADVARFGFYVGERAKDVKNQFRQRVLEDPQAFYKLVRELGLIRDFQFDREDPEGGREKVQVSSADDLQKWVESGDYDLLRYMEPDDVVAQGPAFADSVFDAMRRVFPVYLWAVAEDHLVEIERYLADVFPDVDEEVEHPPEPYTQESFASATHLLPQTIADLRDMVNDKRQLIFFGPPGTGKTFVAQELGKLLTGLADPPPERMEIVQFHPAYGYEDFVEGIRPESTEYEGRYVVNYPAKAGAFRRFCQNALRHDGPCVFIIDEINRGNIPRIFGELMLLLEYRDLDVPLPYSGKRFRIPKNVFIIGTMNTADRSIALVDFALRRRFHFFRFDADPELFERWAQRQPGLLERLPYLPELYRQLSREAIDDPNYAIGPSYFMDPDLTETKLERIWRRSIVPYLEEYYFEQEASVTPWRWDSREMRGIRIRENPGFE